MKKSINIFLWYVFDKKRYNLYEYIMGLGFNSDSAFTDTKNSNVDVVNFLTSKNIGPRIFH